MRAPIVLLRTVATAIILAALCLGWSLPVSAQITLSTLPIADIGSPTAPTTVIGASAALQTTIQNFAANPTAASAMDVTDAQTAYNLAVSTRVGPSPATGSGLFRITASTTVSGAWDVVPDQASVIFATETGSLTFGPGNRVTVANAGGFFLGTEEAKASPPAVGASLPFVFSGISSGSVNGGAIANSGTATITGGSFTSNQISGAVDGAAIANSGILTITGSSFTNNFGQSLPTGATTFAQSHGGAISNSGTLTIFGSSFIGNRVGNQGGAIYQTAGTSTIANSLFQGNMTGVGNDAPGFGGGRSGGAIRIIGASAGMIVTHTDFIGNKAFDGGGALSNDGILSITGGTFQGNDAGQGNGGAIVNNGTASITGATFEDNIISTGRDGGAISNGNQITTASLTISDSTFTGNRALINRNAGIQFSAGGGAISMLQGTANITDSNFEQNTATGNGGAIWGGPGTIITLTAMNKNVAVTDNNTTAGGLGGGIYLNGGSLTLSATGGDIMFSGNTQNGAPNAIFMTNDPVSHEAATAILNAGAGHAITFVDPIASNGANGLVTVTKTGTGTVLFHGSSTVYAKTEVSAGAFELATNATYGDRAEDVGGTTPSSFTVGPGATFLGGVAATVRADEFTLGNNGTLNLFLPRSATGTRGVFTIDTATDTATFQPTSVTVLGIGGRDGNQYDHIMVGGNVALGGTLTVISLQDFHPVAGDIFGILRNSGTRSGNWTHLDESQFNITPSIITGHLPPIAVEVVAPNGVDLVYVKRPPTIPPPTIPPPTIPPPTGPEPPIIDETPELLPPVEPEAPIPEEEVVQLLDPTAAQLTSLYQVSFTGAWLQRSNLDDRMFQLQQSYVPPPPAPPPPTTKEAVGKELAPPPAPSAPRWGVWASGYGNWTNLGTNQGYHFDTAGMSAGVDYLLTPHWAVGLFGGYSHNWINFKSNGSADSDTGLGGLYSTYFDPTGWWVNAAVWGGGTSYSTSRQALLGPANASTNGWLISTYGEAGYDLHSGPLAYGPYVLMQYTDVDVSGFSENGSLVPLDVRGDSQDSLVTDVGGRLYYKAQLGQMAVIPQLKLAWEHEYLYSSLPLSVTAPTLGGATATFHGPSIGHDSLVINAGAELQINPRIAITISYDGQLARDHYYSNAVTGTFSFSF